MHLTELVLNCPDCGEWFTGRQAHGRLVELENGNIEEKFYCPNHAETELHDADTYGIPTPYAQLRAEVLKDELVKVQERERELEKEIKKLLQE